MSALGNAYAREGKTADARKLLGELQQRSKQRYVSWCHIANIYAGLGENDQAFASLEKPTPSAIDPRGRLEIESVA